MPSKNTQLLHLWLLEAAADFFSVVASYFVVFWIRFYSGWGEALFTVINRLLGIRETSELSPVYELFYAESALRIVLLITATVLLLHALLDLYSSRRPIRKRMIAWNIILANTVALTVFYVYFYISRNVFHPRSFFVTIMPLNALICICTRQLLYSGLVKLRRKTGIDVVNAVIVGTGEDADFIRNIVTRHNPHGIVIRDTMPLDLNIPFEQTLKGIADRIHDSGGDMLITADRSLSVAQIMLILEQCAEEKIPAKILSEELSVIVNQARIKSDLVKGIPLMHFAAPSDNRLVKTLRRMANLLLASLLIVVFSPLLLLSALLIRLTSHGNILFRQERIGVTRKPFTMLKFRTMHERADELVAQLEEFNESGQGLFKIKQDPRTTAVGRILRRLSIDELPQLFNVLKGDMSVIGPRPLPRRDFEGYYENWHYSRHAGLPGITCLWQVSGRSDLDFHNMCILDVYYLRNRTWVLDIKILFRTVQAVLFARGAY